MICSIEIIDGSPSESLDVIVQPEMNTDEFSSSENEEDTDNDDDLRRASSFLRFGRAMSANSGNFLRFGRQVSPTTGSFLRFGRQISPQSASFLRFGRGGHAGGSFLRFGRRAANLPTSNFHRFARKGEFLRFG